VVRDALGEAYPAMTSALTKTVAAGARAPGADVRDCFVVHHRLAGKLVAVCFPDVRNKGQRCDWPASRGRVWPYCAPAAVSWTRDGGLGRRASGPPDAGQD
jgi:hypothetical protein